MADPGTAYGAASERLRDRPLRWLVTGSAGFIGSHLIEALLRLGQHVVGLDNFATGFRRNLDEVQAAVGRDAWRRHRFIEASIIDLEACRDACQSIDVVLHQAALGSVPRSIEDPLRTHAVNATGFLNLLVAARDAEVGRFVYAASSSTYGDHPGLPKVEEAIGRPLSPYAVTKYLDELYADVFGRYLARLDERGLRVVPSTLHLLEPGDDGRLVGPRTATAGSWRSPSPTRASSTASSLPRTTRPR